MNSVINWMGGWPKEGLISAADWEERVESAAIVPEPYAEEKLRDQLAASLLKEKAGESVSRIRFTMGADGALAWIVSQLLAPGDVVLTEKLTSRSALQLFRKAGIKAVAVDGDRRGMDPEALTRALQRYRPKLVYVSPACTDPEGISWSRRRRTAVQAECRKAGVLLVSDDRQEMLLYDPEAARLSQVRLEPGMLSIGQLPPGLIAGLRIGWIAGVENGAGMPSMAYEDCPRKDLLAGALEQRTLSRLIEDQPIEPLLDMLRVQCRERLRLMTEHLHRQGIADLAWVEPQGGLHLWISLPPGLDGESLLRGAWLKGVIFQPGAPFYADSPCANTIRITHAFADERQIKMGVSKLAESIGEFMGRWSRN
ncbi:aminotransferase class I/II-fold pyridoxal phosphate-dependent enzyme [Cohnella terricola]|uniref:aminotransferase class I/II-fold pyridoxal phosphate-dependent enzyme n=1 Tax=Cohnella terricola TaxID=1289167 RepID=UPI001648FB03|nr:PLP-dependent aminotransferase family protein [Cohnella terricola]